MIYALLLGYNKKCSQKCFQLLSVLLYVVSMFDPAMTTQGNKPKSLNGRIEESNFDKDNQKSFLSHSANELEILSSLSSKYKPSSPSNYNLTSSRNDLLAQGSLQNATLTSHFRMDSYTLEPFKPMAGCISLLNYYWRHKLGTVNEESLFRVQIFIFHLYNNSTPNLKIDLRILLESTSNMTFSRPITIVLSSFLPRRISLSVMSYLSLTRQPIHILLTNFATDIFISDTDLKDSDMAKIFIGVLDRSYNNVFENRSYSNQSIHMQEIRRTIVKTDLYKFGSFSGFRYNSISTDRSLKSLWLFDNGVQYSKRIPEIKLVAIYMVLSGTNIIDLILNKQEEPRFPLNNVFYQDQCTDVKSENYAALDDRIKTFLKTKFPIDEARTYTSHIKASSPASEVHRNYTTVTWLHFESDTSTNIHLKLSSNRFSKDDQRFLVIISAENMNFPTICIESFFLHKRVHIISNISLDDRCRHSLLLVSVEPMNTNPSNATATRHQMVANYIISSSFVVMQTTTYKLQPNRTYEIRVNVDDSQVYSYRNAIVNPKCLCNPKTKGYLSLSIDLRIWKRFNSWIPEEFQLGSSGGIFKRINDSYVTFTASFNECTISAMESYQNKIYGIWRNKRFLLNMPFKCESKNNSKTIKTINQFNDTADDKEQNLIAISDKGFYIFENANFKNLVNKSFRDKDRIYMEIDIDIADTQTRSGIQLRDCYFTNRRASADDLDNSNSSNPHLQKLIIVKGGCINQSSPLYSDIVMARRPINHSSVDFVAYKFSVGIDVDILASELFLYDQWMNKSQIEVHLYCGIDLCLLKTETDIVECDSLNGCFQNYTREQSFYYYGPLLIEKEKYNNNIINKNVTIGIYVLSLKISVLTMLSIVTSILVLCLIIFLWRLRKYHLRSKYCRSVIIGVDDWRTCHADRSTTPATKIHYQSLKLLDRTCQKSIVKLCPDKNLYSAAALSSQQLIIDTDKSIILQAGYLSTLVFQDQKQCSAIDAEFTAADKKSRQLSHSLSEFSISDKCIVNRALCSWPLSSTYRNRRSYHSQPQSSSSRKDHHHLPNRYSFRSVKNHESYRLTLSSKLKLFITSEPRSLSYLSNTKLSSNRTTMSGESASACDTLPNNNISHKSLKWWSPISNCSVNKSFVTSRY